MKITILSVLSVIIIGFAGLGWVQSNAQKNKDVTVKVETTVSGAMSEKDLKIQLTKALSTVFSKNAIIVGAKATSIESVYEVLFNDGTIVYTTLDGEYFFYGKDMVMFKANGGNLVNLTASTIALAEKNQAKNRIPALQTLERDDLIVFTPKGEVKASVIVFTDIDCGYCRKLHTEIDSYLELGIEIKYAAFPRAGLSGKSYDKIVTAWCAPNQQETMTLLKSNQSVTMQTCDNPVAQQYQLGRQVGVTGTPSIFTEDGRIVPGYRPAKELAAVLGL